nr:hypothetical protein [Tanacetum cinerariifolium]
INAIGVHYLPHSSEYVAPQSIDVVRHWFPTTGYGEEVFAKGTLRKSLLPPRWRSSKAPTSFKTSHSKKRQEFSSTMDSNLRQPPVSTHMDTRMHKEDQQATGGPTSSGVTSEERVNPQLSSFVLPHVLADQTQYVSEGLEIILIQPTTGKGASFIAIQVVEEESSRTIKLEDLAKLVSNAYTSFKDLDSSEDDYVIVVAYGDEDEEDEVHVTKNAKIEDTSVPKSSPPRSSQIQKLANQPTFPNVGQLNKLLVKSLQTKFSKILSARNFSSSLPTELKDLPSKFNKLTKEPPVSTHMDTRMHKEDQQATGGPTSSGVTSEERVNPQLNYTAEAGPGLSAPNNFISQQQ